jgi:uncharacterized membrane protein YgdD (TMEM256/DUF423 family)
MDGEPKQAHTTPGIKRTNAAAIAFGALLGLGGVSLGAYAAHGAAAELRPGLETASLYAMLHGLALIGTALVHDRIAGRAVARAVTAVSMLCFALGSVLFSGGIFLAGFGHYPGTAPLGGILLMTGWAGLLLAGLTLLVKIRRT